MSSEPPDPSSLAVARDARRWLIGVSISLVFGLFGVVMALLGYWQRASPPAPNGAGMPAKRGQLPAAPRSDHRFVDRHR
jgi:hypothetical protein